MQDEQIKKLTADLEAANKEIESLAYAVSHDLRAPLRAIEGFTAVLLEDYKAGLDAEGQRFLEIIGTSSRRVSLMVEGILSYSRFGRHEMTLSEIDTNELIRAVLTDVEPVLQKRKIEFKVSPLPTTRGDYFLLREIWKILIGNAVKFTRNKPEAIIEISGKKEGNETVFTVRDNGVGFDPSYSDKLFQVFQRLHSENEFEGVGVGLAIAQRLVRRHNGNIWAEATPEVGATFHFSLPG
jgi:two-component system sensor kinase